MQKLLGLPVLASEHGKDVDNLIIYVHWLMIVLFIGWLAYFAYALFRFHCSRNPRADYVGVKNHASSYIEVAGAAGAGGLVVFVGGPPLGQSRYGPQGRSLDPGSGGRPTIQLERSLSRQGWKIRQAKHAFGELDQY